MTLSYIQGTLISAGDYLIIASIVTTKWTTLISVSLGNGVKTTHSIEDIPVALVLFEAHHRALKDNSVMLDDVM